MTTKKTKKELFTALYELISAENPEEEDLLELVSHELDLLEKKQSSPKNKQKLAEDETLQGRVMEMIDGNSMTSTELARALSEEYPDEYGTISSQKITSVMKPLIDIRITVTKDKGRSYLRLI